VVNTRVPFSIFLSDHLRVYGNLWIFFLARWLPGFNHKKWNAQPNLFFRTISRIHFLITITFVPFLMAVSFYKCFTRDKLSCQCFEHLPRLVAYRGQWFHDCPTLPRKTYILPCYIFTCKSTYFRRENCRRMEICYYAYNFIYFEIRYEDSLFSK